MSVVDMWFGCWRANSVSLNFRALTFSLSFPFGICLLKNFLYKDNPVCAVEEKYISEILLIHILDLRRKTILKRHIFDRVDDYFHITTTYPNVKTMPGWLSVKEGPVLGKKVLITFFFSKRSNLLL